MRLSGYEAVIAPPKSCTRVGMLIERNAGSRAASRVAFKGRAGRALLSCYHITRRVSPRALQLVSDYSANSSRLQLATFTTSSPTPSRTTPNKWKDSYLPCLACQRELQQLTKLQHPQQQLPSLQSCTKAVNLRRPSPCCRASPCPTLTLSLQCINQQIRRKPLLHPTMAPRTTLSSPRSVDERHQRNWQCSKLPSSRTRCLVKPSEHSWPAESE